MKKRTHSFKGFTVLEMLLYVSVCSFLLLALSLFLTSLFGVRVKNQSIADVNQQGQQVMKLLTETIKNAKSIEIPNIGATSSSLSVTVEDAMLSPTIFDVSSGTMRISEGGGPNILLTNSHVTVNSLLFENISSTSSTDRIIRVSFTIDYKNQNGRNEYTFSKSFIGSATMR